MDSNQKNNLSSDKQAMRAAMSVMQASIISERAYAIWERQGRPNGQALDHWLQAEAELKDAAPAHSPADQSPSAAAVADESPKAVVRSSGKQALAEEILTAQHKHKR
jgi:hypothetical protein